MSSTPRRRSLRLAPSSSSKGMKFDDDGNLIGSGGSLLLSGDEDGEISGPENGESDLHRDSASTQSHRKSARKERTKSSISLANGHLQHWANEKVEKLEKDVIAVVPESKELKPFIERWEIPRKAMHSSISLVVISTWVNGITSRYIVRCLLTFLLVVLSADYTRLHWPYFAEVYETLLGPFMREKEKKGVTGFAYYLLGCAISLSVFPEDVAAVSVLILSLCDTSASTFGKALGRYTPNLPRMFAARKTVAGMTASILTGSLIALGFWGYLAPLRQNAVLSWRPPLPVPDLSGLAQTIAHKSVEEQAAYIGDYWREFRNSQAAEPNVSRIPIWLLAIGVGLISGVAEAIDMRGLDDNLTLPILSGLGIWVLLYCTR